MLIDISRYVNVIDSKRHVEKILFGSLKNRTCSKVTLDQLLSEQIPGNIIKALGGKDPSGASKSLISLFDLTTNMADLTLNTTSKEIKKSSNKVSQTYVIKKRTKSKHPAVQNSCLDKNSLPSTEQLLLTLMEEVKGVKKQILIPSYTSSSVSQACSSKTPKQKDYLKRFVWYLDSGCSRHMIGVKQYLHIYSKEPGPKVVFGDDSSGDTEGYGSVNCNGITFTRVAYVNGLKHNLIASVSYVMLTSRFCLQRPREPFSTKMMRLFSLLQGERMFIS
ncbi:hypothetical protein Tco_0672649 [Tanacetum coccineum]